MTQEQVDVYFLHVEILETSMKAIHPEPDRPQTSRTNSGASVMLDWALDYRRCLPENDDDRRLLEKAHQSKKRLKLDRKQARRLGGLIRAFYWRLHERRLYTKGVKYLRWKR